MTLLHAALGFVMLSGPTEPEYPRLAVIVDQELIASGRVDRDLIIAALQKRLQPGGVQVSSDNSDPAADVRAMVEQQPHQRIRIRIEASNLPPSPGSVFRARGARETVAHTAALLIVEALAPVWPEAIRRIAPESASNELDELVNALPPEPPEVIDGPRWAVDVGAMAGVLSPPVGHIRHGVASSASVQFGLVRYGAFANWWSRLRRRGEDYRVDLEQLLVGLHAGVAGRSRLVGWAATAGPLARVVLLDARGAGVRFRHRTLVDPGIGLRFEVSALISPVVLTLRVDSDYFFRHPRLVVDGKRVLNVGSFANSLTTAMGYEF